MTRRLILGTAAALVLVPIALEDILRVSVAEYSSVKGRYFEELAYAFEGENPDEEVRIDLVPGDVLSWKLATHISHRAALTSPSPTDAGSSTS